MKPIIGEQEFIKRLDAWVFKNTQADAAWIAGKKSSGIPPYFRTFKEPLYRGMIVDPLFLESVNAGKMVFKDYTSWTKDPSLAKKFAGDKKYSIAKKGTIPILIKKAVNPSDQILDIDSLIQFMGMQQMIMLGFDELALDSASKESEVLCEKGIKILAKDVSMM